MSDGLGETVFTVIIRDITERRRAEEAIAAGRQRFEAIFSHSKEGIFLLDDAGRCVDANPAGSSLTGYSRDVLLAMDIRGITLPEDHGDVAQGWAEFLAAGERSGEYTITTNGGATRDIEYQAVANITPGVHLWVLRDITHRKQVDAALMHAQKLESLSALAGGVAHDFNNLLVAVLGNADLALEDLAPESPAVDSILQVKVAARRAADLAREMLAFSGRGRFVVERLDMSVLVEEMTHLLNVSLAKGAVLKFNFGPNLPAIQADPTQIRQLVMNLLVNASDAIGDRSGVISITTGVMRCDREYLNETFLRPDLAEGDYVYLEVSDTGAGMDAATRDRIFDPFFTTKPAGRGLGLSAVLGIVRAHRGALKVYSELGKGSTFKVLLPSIDEPADPVREHPAAAAWTGSGTVLVVDDQESIRAVAARALERFGFEVILAQDGREAIERFRENQDRIRVVLLDKVMPRLGGEETFRELRRIKPDIPVVVMSGYNEAEATEEFAGKGIAGFIQKPFELSALRDAIREALQG
ncbi:MAG: response regulator [Chloroflexi bacterium]|nr:response regulator [Chloroflexota bacterium]